MVVSHFLNSESASLVVKKLLKDALLVLGELSMSDNDTTQPVSQVRLVAG